MSNLNTQVDDELALLDLEIKREELRQLRSNQKFQWFTPAAIAILLPMIGASLLWIISELKEYSDAHQALAQVKTLEVRMADLQTQKDGLNIEISTLVDLKNHYAEEAVRIEKIVDDRQKIVDQIYLKGKYAASEGTYALRHATSTRKPDEEALEKVAKAVRESLPEVSDEVSSLLINYEFYKEMGDVTLTVLEDFQKSLEKYSPSADALKLNWNPQGYLGIDRAIMTTNSPDKIRYYDVELGRYLSNEELPKNVQK